MTPQAVVGPVLVGSFGSVMRNLGYVLLVLNSGYAIAGLQDGFDSFSIIVVED